MNLLRFLPFGRGRRAADRRGAPPAVLAALRAKRARDHLDRQRRRGRRRGVAGGADAAEASDGPVGGFAAETFAAGTFAAGIAEPPIGAAPEVFRLEPPRSAAAPERSERRRAAGAARPAGPSREAAAGRPAPDRAAARRGSSTRAAAPRVAPRAGSNRGPARGAAPTAGLPRFAALAAMLLALGAGVASGRPLFERFWLPHARLERVAVLGAGVRAPATIARALLDRAGTPIDRIDAAQVEARVLGDPWIAAADSLRLPDGTLLVRVVERRAVARYRGPEDAEFRLVDPDGRVFAGEVGAAGALPLVAGALGESARGEGALPATALEIVAELGRHGGLARDLAALTLHLPGDPPGDGDPAADPLAGEAGFVLELGDGGTRALLGQTYLKRRIARLATLLAQPDALLASAQLIDLRYADRAVLRTAAQPEPAETPETGSEPTSG